MIIVISRYYGYCTIYFGYCRMNRFQYFPKHGHYVIIMNSVSHLSSISQRKSRGLPSSVDTYEFIMDGAWDVMFTIMSERIDSSCRPHPSPRLLQTLLMRYVTVLLTSVVALSLFLGSRGDCVICMPGFN
jgi:hypothetical protein